MLKNCTPLEHEYIVIKLELEEKVFHVTELLHYIGAKYLSNEMGGSNHTKSVKQNKTHQVKFFFPISQLKNH